MSITDYDSCAPPPSRGGSRFKPNVLEAARALGIETEGRRKADLCRAIAAQARLAATTAGDDEACAFPPSRGGMRYRPDLLKAAAALGIDAKGLKKRELCQRVAVQAQRVARQPAIKVVQPVAKPAPPVAPATKVEPPVAKPVQQKIVAAAAAPAAAVSKPPTRAQDEFVIKASENLNKEHEQKLIALGLLNVTVNGPTCHVAQCDVQKAIQEATRAFGGPDEAFEARVQQVLRANPVTLPAPGKEEEYDEKYSRIATAVWTAALPTSWYHVMRLYTLFLEGKIPASPTHQGPLTLDVQNASVKTLLDINRLGFVTIDSQPGVCESFDVRGVRGIEVQREYIQGSFPAKYSKLLFDKLVQVAGNYIEITVHRPTEPLPTDKGEVILATYLKQNPEDTHQLVDDEEVTVEELFRDADPNRDALKKYYNHPEFDFYDAKTGVASHLFHLVARDYCRPGLVAQCLRYALCSIQPLPAL